VKNETKKSYGYDKDEISIIYMDMIKLKFQSYIVYSLHMHQSLIWLL